jgi:hypothetical protein
MTTHVCSLMLVNGSTKTTRRKLWLTAWPSADVRPASVFPPPGGDRQAERAAALGTRGSAGGPHFAAEAIDRGRARLGLLLVHERLEHRQIRGVSTMCVRVSYFMWGPRTNSVIIVDWEDNHLPLP